MEAQSPHTRVSLWIGVAAVVLIPIAHLHGVNRFALLPQLLCLQVCALSGMVVWSLARGTSWKWSPLVLPVLAFLLAEIISTTGAMNRTASLLAISTHTGFALFFLFLLNGLDRNGFKKVLTAASAAAAILSIFGVAQYFGWARTWVPTAGLPSATLGHRNIAAAYLVGMLPLTFWVWYNCKRSSSILIWGAALGFEGAFLLGTRSRGAWIGIGFALICVGVLGVIHGRRQFRDGLKTLTSRPRLAALSVAILLTFGLGTLPAEIRKGEGEAMWDNKQSIQGAVSSVFHDGGDRGRLTMWKRTLEMVSARPIIGVGAGNWRLAYPAFAQGDLIDPGTVSHRPHNDLLWIWAEMGTLGLGLYLFLLYTAGRMGIALLKRPERRLIGGVLICAILSAVINSLFSFPREFPAAWLPFYLSLAGISLLSPVGEKRGAWVRGVVYGAVGVLIAGIWLNARQIGFDRHTLQLRLAFAESNWSEAIQEAKSALSWGAFDEDTFFMRGRAYDALGMHGEALGDFEQGLAYHPNSPGMWNGLGDALRGTGDTESALEAYGRALKLNPRSGIAYNNIGSILASAGERDVALAAFQKAVTYRPDLPAAHANMSVLHRLIGDADQATLSALRALRLDPNHLEALNALGNAYVSDGRFSDAVEAFSHAIVVDSSQAEIYFNLGQVFEQRGDLGNAISSYEAFFRLWNGREGHRIESLSRRLERLKAQHEG